MELSAVTEDNRVLKQRIQTLESELKKWVPRLFSLHPSLYWMFSHVFIYFLLSFRYRRENNRLSSDQSRLQATYREIENQSKFLSEKIMRQQVCEGSKTFQCFWSILAIWFSTGSTSLSLTSVVFFVCVTDNSARQDREGDNREKAHGKSGKQAVFFTCLYKLVK